MHFRYAAAAYRKCMITALVEASASPTCMITAQGQSSAVIMHFRYAGRAGPCQRVLVRSSVNKRSFNAGSVAVALSGRAEELLDAAARCFAYGGFHATTVAEISLEAGCSPGLLYRYFASKEALVAALVEREAERTVAALEAARDSTDLLAALDAAAIATCWDDARSAALHVQIVAEAARGGAGAVSESVRRTYTDVIAALAATLRVGQEAGVVDDAIDADAAARLLVAVVNGVVMLRAAGVGDDAPPAGDATRALLARILQPAREGQHA